MKGFLAAGTVGLPIRVAFVAVHKGRFLAGHVAVVYWAPTEEREADGTLVLVDRTWAEPLTWGHDIILD